MKRTLILFCTFFIILMINGGKGDRSGVYDNMKDAEIDDYGNWCGGGHGGYQDCCNGAACSNCNYKNGLTAACLEQCPPIDEVDFACARHDTCCFKDPKSIICLPQGNLCECDCALTNEVETASCPNLYCSGYAASLQITFRTVLSCYWYTPNYTTGEDCGANKNNLCAHGTYF